MLTKEERDILEELLRRLVMLERVVSVALPMVLSKEQAMRELGDISDGKLRSMVRKGQLVRCRVGDGWGYPRKEIERIRDDLEAPKVKRGRPRRATKTPAKPPESFEDFLKRH